MAEYGSGEPRISINRAFLIYVQGALNEPTPEFAGRVEHVVSGKAARFYSVTELLEFIAEVETQEPHHRSTTDNGDPST